MSNFKKITHVLFDLDGVIIDSEGVYEKIINDIASQYGKTYTPEVRLKLLGTTEQMTSAIACREMDLPITPEEFRNQMAARSHLLEDVDLLKGAKELIEHLHSCGVPVAVATSSGDKSVAIKTSKQRPLFSKFHHVVMGSSDPEVKAGKPSPDIYLICAARFPDNPDPDNCLVIEDAPNGVISGLAAGMQVVMVPDPAMSIDTSILESATQVLTSLEDFKPELFGLPPFKQI